MIASEARIAANLANGLKSKGPVTARGKEISRANSYKHGMTGAGVVVPHAVAEEIAQRVAGFQKQFRPVTVPGRSLLDRAAMLSVRMERCADHESAAIGRNVRHARDDFDQARLAEVEALMGSIGDEPATRTRLLGRMPEGVERMISAWADLKSDLGHGDKVRWTAEHEELAENLNGRTPRSFGTSRVRVLSRAIRGDFDLVGPEEGMPKGSDDRKAWARGRMGELIEEEIARLQDHLETLDYEVIEADRAAAPQLALFDSSKEAILARRYEAAAERGMFRALREMREIEAEVVPEECPGPSEFEVVDRTRLGSFLPAAPVEAARPVAPAPMTPATASGQLEAFLGPRYERLCGISDVPIEPGRSN